MCRGRLGFNIDFLGTFALCLKAPIGFVMPVSPSVYLSVSMYQRSSHWTSMKHDIGNFYENLRRNSRFCLKTNKYICHCKWKLSTFYCWRQNNFAKEEFLFNSVFLNCSQWHVGQQYWQHAFLPFHCNNS
jgi:hypothetical protein